MKHLLILFSFLLLSSPLYGDWIFIKKIDEITNENESFITTTSINKQGLGIFSTTGTFNVRLSSNNLGMYVNFNKYIKDLKDYDNVHKKIMLKFDKGEIINLTGTLSTDGKAVFFNDLDKNILLKK